MWSSEKSLVLRHAPVNECAEAAPGSGALSSLALQVVVGMAAMVPDDEDAHTIAHNSKEEVIGEAFEVGSPEAGF